MILEEKKSDSRTGLPKKDVAKRRCKKTLQKDVAKRRCKKTLQKDVATEMSVFALNFQ
jgi:hypothetical protein